jgi:hypothetical protein
MADEQPPLDVNGDKPEPEKAPEPAGIPNLHLHTPAVTLEQRYLGTNVTDEDIERQNAFETGVSQCCGAGWAAGGGEFEPQRCSLRP